MYNKRNYIFTAFFCVLSNYIFAQHNNISFSISQSGKTNKLSWQLLSADSSFNYLQIEKSKDSISYTDIARYTISAPYDKTYSLNDNLVSEEPVYYRIKITTLSGESYFSKTVLSQNESQKISAYPSPASALLNIKHCSIKTDNASLKIYTVMGTLVKECIAQKGETATIVDVSSIATGVYIVTITDGAAINSTRFLKQ